MSKKLIKLSNEFLNLKDENDVDFLKALDVQLSERQRTYAEFQSMKQFLKLLLKEDQKGLEEFFAKVLPVKEADETNSSCIQFTEDDIPF